ncbi:Uncharacterised protein [Slackia heliotrinireducens]|uniref:Uncharacterized protein n=1 Tax=Slackia heliotrinireducens (strain ATCC 29202 / DSM 20476 / NCTC 11029 / RHS 1) TaxID=471855 RepID=C7N7K4_SLAHD|nr:hypothetical protein [Slackia heliotrinireducens]ACV22889.1 hypothetical protein Shel_18730 [Slackia heliotrinireducens DSM 20476]VEH01672.1 Uncharacterised protein [Slackia heliotrinireducens]
MTVLTNRLDASVDLAGFDEAFDVYEVEKQGEGRLSWSSRAFEPGGAPFIEAVLGQGSGKPFYILTGKGATDAKGLRGHFESALCGKVEGEDVDPDDVGLMLLPRRVEGGKVPAHVLVQLMVNALGAGGAGTGLQNVTGHLYCVRPSWSRKRRGEKKPYQVWALELRVTEGMLLCADVCTFTRPDEPGVKYGKYRKEQYARYVVDLGGPTMRRVMPGERPGADSVFVRRTYEGSKNSVDFLSFRSRDAYRDSKCGVMSEFVSTFNKRYEGIAHVAFAEEDRAGRVAFEGRLAKPGAGAGFSGHGYRVVNAAKDEDGESACRYVAQQLKGLGLLGANADVEVAGEPGEGARNIVVVHAPEFYRDSGTPDPYGGSAGAEAPCQHLTIERLQAAKAAVDKDGKKTSALKAILEKCLMELAIKNDVLAGRMGVFDWTSLGLSGPVTFALPGPETDAERESRKPGEPPTRYSFAEVTPEGSLSFHAGCADDALGGGRWDVLAGDLAAEYGLSGASVVEGFVIGDNGEVDVIERTEGFPVPDLEVVEEQIRAFDWTMPKDDVLAALSTASDEPLVDGARAAVCEAVEDLPGEAVTSAQLYGIVKDVGRSQGGTTLARTVKNAISDQLEEMFAKRLSTSVPRGKENRAGELESLVGLQCYRRPDGICYWVGAFGGLPNAGWKRGMTIRRVRSADGGEPSFSSLLGTLLVPVVRIRDATVLPLPFKHLREWQWMQAPGGSE